MRTVIFYTEILMRKVVLWCFLVVVVVVVFIFQNLSSTSIGINIYLWASMYSINMGIKKHNNEMSMH